MKLTLGLASVAVCLTTTSFLMGGHVTLPSYITSRKDLPEFITAPHDAQAKPVGEEQAGYYYQTYQGPDKVWHVQLVDYKPMPGDLLLFDDHNKIITFMYQMVGTGAPLHAAMIVARPDQTPAILEAGPNFIPKVFVVDPLRRMRAYPGTVLIRRPRQPLTQEQSDNLTRFAMAQDGKDYALTRLFMQATPFRPRVGLRKICFGHTCLERKRWTCSELTATACTVIGLLDSRRFPANAMYPRDFCYDDRFDLSSSYAEPLLWTEHPTPATLERNERGQLRLVFQK